jgi:hypothetical protein
MEIESLREVFRPLPSWASHSTINYNQRIGMCTDRTLSNTGQEK